MDTIGGRRLIDMMKEDAQKGDEVLREIIAEALAGGKFANPKDWTITEFNTTMGPYDRVRQLWYKDQVIAEKVDYKQWAYAPGKEPIKKAVVSQSPVYRCEFKILDKKAGVYVSRLSDVKDGFWINESFEFTTGSDASMWIPPSSINHVLKITDLNEKEKNQ